MIAKVTGEFVSTLGKDDMRDCEVGIPISSNATP